MSFAVSSPVGLQLLRNAALVLLSFVFLPLSILLCTTAEILQRLSFTDKDVTPKTAERSRVLVTGVGMTKGLFVARTMYRGGCAVIAADFDRNANFHCGRFSRSVSRFYALVDPVQAGSQAYIDQVVSIVKAERIELWISCSGVATAIEDAELAATIRDRTDCAVFQLSKDAVSVLDDKLRFMHQTTKLGLANMTWFEMRSPQDIADVIRSVEAAEERDSLQYIIKSASMDDASRGSLPLLDGADTAKMSSVLHDLNFSKGRQWILQEFITSGEEYCTHALVVCGKVLAFTACRSEAVLMHYKQLEPSSILFNQMLQFTMQYVSGMEDQAGKLTGHVSFDFLIKYKKTNAGFEGVPVPIECNPRCHTATVLFRGREKELADCYLSTMGMEILAPKPLINICPSEGYYWAAHDIVTLIIMPLLDAVRSHDMATLKGIVSKFLSGIEHLITWKDPTFEWWDPLPWLVLNHVYWPVELAAASVKGIRWKQLNVSTTKIFKC